MIRLKMTKEKTSDSILLVIIVFLLLALSEIILRLPAFLYESPQSTYVKTHEIKEKSFFMRTADLEPPYITAPNQLHHFWWKADYRTNSEGFLGDPTSKTGSINILCLGDSVTFGIGVRQSQAYPELLRNTLPNARIGNLAGPGYNTEDEVGRLKQVLKQGAFRPDIILLQFNRNDYETHSRLVKTKMGYDLYGRLPTLAFVPPTAIYKFLLDRSEVFFRVHHLLTWLLKDKIKMVPYPDRALEINNKLQELRNLGDRIQAKCIFLYCPNNWPEDPSEQFLRELREFKSHFDYSLDLSGILDKNDPQLWFNKNGHPSVKGHELIAQTLLDYLNKKILV